MRSIKELLELMLQHQNLFQEGLCSWALTLKIKDIITRQEYDTLHSYISHNRPDYFSWTNFINSYGSKNCGYYFPWGKIKPRIYWIKTHIKRLS